MQQLVTIEEQGFADPIINFVKDLFLHSCYAGFAFADAKVDLDTIVDLINEQQQHHKGRKS